MMYPEEMVRPMREELTGLGFRELRSAAEVNEILGRKRGSVLVVVNSICGCAAGKARPGVSLALRHSVRPETLVTVFAGQDAEATASARSFFSEFPPSSPSVCLLVDGRPVHMLHRHQIEGRLPEEIAKDLTAAFDRFCRPADGSATLKFHDH
jgi:bacilliredoxin